MSQLARPAAARADVARLAARLEELLARPAVHRPLVLVAVLVLAWRWGSHPSARTAALLFAPLPLAMLLRAPTLLLPGAGRLPPGAGGG